jgi:hypothetical protein
VTDDITRALAELAARVTALESWRAHQTDLLDDLLNGHPGLDIDPDIDADDDVAAPVDPPPLDGEALIEWVHDTVAAVTARPLRGEYAWCPRWWEHPEAVFRFEALHRAWTELAPEPGVAMSLWIRDHLDPCLRELLHPSGPFTDCAHHERQPAHAVHRPLPTLPTQQP